MEQLQKLLGANIRCWFPVPDQSGYQTGLVTQGGAIIAGAYNSERGYQGIIVPSGINYSRATTPTDIQRAIFDKVPNHRPPLTDEEIKANLFSLSPLYSLSRGIGQCYQKASIGAAIADASGIENRIAGSTHPFDHFWIKILDETTGEWIDVDTIKGNDLSRFKTREFTCLEQVFEL